MSLLIHDADEVLVTTRGATETVQDRSVLVEDGEVAEIGRPGELRDSADRTIDADGRTVLPGFVDAHTHAVFAGDRSDEFVAKIEGKTYQQIMAEGGGIMKTVRHTREASEDRLVELLLDRLDIMLEHGSTTVEIKSGYGLETGTELKMLRAIERAGDQHPVDVVPTFLGAHAVPDGTDAEGYTEEVISEQLPAVAEQGIAEFCDVFCEEDVFTPDQSRRILAAGKEHGLTPKVHAEEFTRLGGAQVAAEVGAASADHLLHAEGEDARAMGMSGVTPVFLPGTAFTLQEEYADPSIFQSTGCEPALATDFNPNCHSHSMGFAVSLACIGMDMLPQDALRAATRGGAKASGLEDRGLLTEGAPADLLVADVETAREVPYNAGTNVVGTVVKDGQVVRGGDA